MAARFAVLAVWARSAGPDVNDNLILLLRPVTKNKKIGTCKLKVAMAVADTSATTESVAQKLGAA